MNYPFNLYQEVQQLPEEKPVKTVVPGFSGLVEGNFIEQLNHIDELSESEIIRIINNNIDVIVEDILTGGNKYTLWFKHIRFISIFTRVCNTRPITSTIRTACNMMIYDYFTCGEGNHEVKSRLIDLASAVNKKEIRLLTAKGFSETLARNLVIARYSSVKEEVDAARVNFVICSQEPEILNTNLVVAIYEVLYDRVRYFFFATMFETYSDEDRRNLGEEFMENFDRVGRAVLTIINNMTSAQIKDLLKLYLEEWVSRKYPPVRFSLRSLSADYGKIVAAVEQLAAVEQIYIP